MEQNKFKQFVRNNFLYGIIAFACLAYIAYGSVKIETSGKTIIEIIGQGIVIFFMGYLICRLFSMQGMLSGDRKEEVIKTNALHARCVADIDCKINEMEDWCDEENAKTLKKLRRQVLNKEGLKYDDCFDSDGVAKEISFPHKELEYVVKDSKGNVVKTLGAREFKRTYPNRFKVERKRVRDFNKRQNAKHRAYIKAMRIKITLLTTNAITATTAKPEDPNNFGPDRKQYQKMEARSDLISKATMGIVFAYFSVNLVFGWAYLISAIIQVAIFLLLGAIKWVFSYYFVTEELRKRTVQQINCMQRFKCDKGLITIAEATKQMEVLGGKEDVNLGKME